MVFGHDEQAHWPRGSQQMDGKACERVYAVRRGGVKSSTKWLSNGHIDEFTGALLQIIFEQSMISLAKQNELFNQNHLDFY